MQSLVDTAYAVRDEYLALYTKVIFLNIYYLINLNKLIVIGK